MFKRLRFAENSFLLFFKIDLQLYKGFSRITI